MRINLDFLTLTGPKGEDFTELQKKLLNVSLGFQLKIADVETETFNIENNYFLYYCYSHLKSM